MHINNCITFVGFLCGDLNNMDISLHDSAYWDMTAQQQEQSVYEPVINPALTSSQKFNRIFAATKDRLYHFVWKLTQHETDTKDIIQNCYLQLWQKITAVDDSREVLPLLFTYARNLVIDHMRRKARQQILLEQFQQHTTTAASHHISAAEQLISYKERMQQLQTSIDQLPAKRKEIFTLVKQDGLSHKMAADQLGISAATVEKQVGLSLKFLRKELGV
jgi:RNA polymerase sigma-70 factor (family 1)